MALSGAAVGWALYRVAEYIARGGIPIISDLWLKDERLTAQLTMAQATALAIGSPQVKLALCTVLSG